jgi:hypothetical protein
MLLDTLVVLKYVSEEFRTYSADDINKLITSKLKKGRDPQSLKNLYDLEKRIKELQMALETENLLNTE